MLVRLFVPNYSDIQNTDVRARFALLIGIVATVCNFLLSAIKFFAGIITGSIAITADATNNLFDAGVGITTAIGFKLASRPADKQHPYGHARYEYLTGLFIAVIIIVVGFELLQTSVQKVIKPTQVTINVVAIAILVFSAVVKLWLMAFYKNINLRINSQAVQAAITDCRNDFISTCAVLLSVCISAITNFNADGYLGAVVSCVIIYSGIRMVKHAADPLIGAAPSKQFTDEINSKILSYSNILGTHDLILHDYGPARRFGSVHVEIDSAINTMDAHNIIDKIEHELMLQYNIIMVIHQDPISVNDNEYNKYYKIISNKVNEISAEMSIHDLRIKKENAAVKLSFDVTVPFDFKMSDEEVKAQISTVQSEKIVLETVTIDRN